MSSRNFFTYVAELGVGGYELREDDEETRLLTPAGHPMSHSSEKLLYEVSAELRAGTPEQLIARMSNYYLLCSQIDEFEHGQLSGKFGKRQISRAILADGVFAQVPGPFEEMERRENLGLVFNFLSSNFAEQSESGKLRTPSLGDFVSPVYSANSVCGPTRGRGRRFIELRDKVHQLVNSASLEQRVVMHAVWHMSESLIAALILAYGKPAPKEFALAALYCLPMTPELADADSSEMLDTQEKIAGWAGIMLDYLENSTTETERLIGLGEGMRVEFKATFRRNLYTGKSDKDIETASLKEIVGFLNTLGGNLLIGVNDDGTVSGITNDIFSNQDRYQTHIANQFRLRVGVNWTENLKYHFNVVNGKPVLRIECLPLPADDVAFLDSDVYIRNASQTVRLSTREAIDWKTSRATQ